MTEPWYVQAYGEHYFNAYRNEFSAEATRAEVDGVLHLLQLSPGSRILDLCCGFGRHSIDLAQRGFDVTGLDQSKALLNHAKLSAEHKQLDISWIHADVQDIPKNIGRYDAVINLFSSFGFLDNDEDEQNVLTNISSMVKPGGHILIDTVNREALLHHWMPWRWREHEDGTLVLERMHFDAIKGQLKTREIIVFPDGSRCDDLHYLRLWTASELSKQLHTAKFENQKFYGDLFGRGYGPETPRLVLVGQRVDFEITS